VDNLQRIAGRPHVYAPNGYLYTFDSPPGSASGNCSRQAKNACRLLCNNHPWQL
jgi:hypothetical protein